MRGPRSRFRDHGGGGGSLTAALIPAERRSEGLALAGVVGGRALADRAAAGLWLADRVGYPPVFIAGAVAALAALAAVPALPGRDTGGVARRPAARAAAARPFGVLAGLRAPALRRPAGVRGYYYGGRDHRHLPAART